MIVSLYGGKCCITGLDVPKLLRASHIIRWADDKENRMNPENGLCLSGTYDLAFDQHLISFDEDYRMIVGSVKLVSILRTPSRAIISKNSLEKGSQCLQNSFRVRCFYKPIGSC